MPYAFCFMPLASMNNSNTIIDALSIDCLIFGFKKCELDILLVQHAEGISKGKWALPGGWIKYNEERTRLQRVSSKR